MNETESRYFPLEKAALALIQAAKMLPHYFQGQQGDRPNRPPTQDTVTEF
jgi:hypothetical protein